MKKNIFIIGVQNDSLVEKLKNTLQKNDEAFVIISKDKILSGLRKNIFQDYYKDIETDNIESSDEYLRDYKLTENEHITSALEHIALESENVNIIFYGELFIPLCQKHWRDRLVTLLGDRYEISMIFLHKEKSKDNGVYHEKRKNHKYRAYIDMKIKRIKETSYIATFSTEDEIDEFYSFT